MFLPGCGQDQKPPPSDAAATSSADMTSYRDSIRPKPPKPIEEMNRAERVAYVRVLADSGFYRCCIDPACTMCLYEADNQCNCGERAKVKDPVCGECYRGWKRGKGSVQGVTPSDIRRQ